MIQKKLSSKVSYNKIKNRKYLQSAFHRTPVIFSVIYFDNIIFLVSENEFPSADNV